MRSQPQVSPALGEVGGRSVTRRTGLAVSVPGRSGPLADPACAGLRSTCGLTREAGCRSKESKNLRPRLPLPVHAQRPLARRYHHKFA
jgi:hypothetical protein